MGVPPGEDDREGVPGYSDGDARPQHTVTITRAFWLGRYPVTRGGTPRSSRTPAIRAGARPGETQLSRRPIATQWWMSALPTRPRTPHGYRARLARPTVCRARQSGNMRRGPAQRRPVSGAMVQPRLAATPMSRTRRCGRVGLAGSTRPIQTRSGISRATTVMPTRPLSGTSNRTASGFMTCWAMSGSGRQIAGTIGTREHRATDQPGQPEIVPGGFCAAAPGSALRGSFAPATATSALPVSAASMLVSAWPEPLSLLHTPPPYLLESKWRSLGRNRYDFYIRKCNEISGQNRPVRPHRVLPSPAHCTGAIRVLPGLGIDWCLKHGHERDDPSVPSSLNSRGSGVSPSLARRVPAWRRLAAAVAASALALPGCTEPTRLAKLGQSALGTLDAAQCQSCRFGDTGYRSKAIGRCPARRSTPPA